MNITGDLKFLTATITSMTDQTNNSKLSPAQKDTLNPPDPNPMGPANKRDTPLDWLNYTKIDVMCTLKHDIR